MPTSLSQCELRHLRYFIAVAEDGSFTRAARRLNISQPPLSMQIRQLETMLGYELFERRPRVALTLAGTSFLPAARRLLAQLSDAADAARFAADGAEGQVFLGFASSAVFDVLPRVLAAFRRSRPQVAVRLRELHSAELAEALR
ncbi:MAG TPA: LysR family transcriptional regulator, partial [Casimicrobiaceae bacterium]